MGINYPKTHFYKVQPTEEFDYVFVASGHYSVPYVPSYPGVDRFPGRVMHSHDFRDACEFAGKRLLIVSNNFDTDPFYIYIYHKIYPFSLKYRKILLEIVWIFIPMASDKLSLHQGITCTRVY